MSWTSRPTPGAGRAVRSAEWETILDQISLLSDQVVIARLSADTTPVVSSTTLVTIAGLVLPLAASTEYVFDLYLTYSSNTTADIKVGFLLPTSAVADF